MLRTELSLRTAAIGCRMQPSLSTPCSYHTAAPSSRRTQDPKTTHCESRHIKMASPLNNPSKQIIRYSSTASSPSPVNPPPNSLPSSARPATTKTASSSSSFPKPSDTLDWNTFFVLRKSRRRLQLGSSIGTSLASMVGGAQGLAMSDMDAIVGQIPLDPFITLGLITFGCGGVGWLLGPIVGTGIFNMMNRKYVEQMATKEKEFYNRIKRYRVDPSASSMANPVPDFYGEKISSVKGYRQWLKDQRAFNKKRQTFV